MSETPLYSYDIRIPKERVAILIGKDGEVKSRLETEAKCKLNVDSKEGDVAVSGADAISLFNAREIIKAIGRGFNPNIAFLLLKGDYVLEMIKLTDFNKHKNHMLRLKGRVIGTKGKSRKFIETTSDTYISVYGKTICIVGRNENVATCRKAISSLLEGSPHSTVYKWLEKQKRELKIREIQGEDIELKDEFKQ